ncbi:ATP-dependent helicase HrpB [Corynebacterium mendelii]|uniref:ATP-dependent helicase HrpB n=1 Tax=Corynebacterium mendelii TaxID=2765362 RepID=A0A939E0H2_9CORY|nr:ATP-dependent helicase HrpB [Corynebacterium mendelii]MBN9644413.1 ATP-dependent helicase HrpB [Corynebacterium mendelii]
MSQPPAFALDCIGRGLPVAATTSAIADKARRFTPLVVVAPPGTGKTTLVPPVIANNVPGRVIVTAPRRVAVRAAARRLAHLDGSRLGDTVGYSVRGEHIPGSRVQFVTPGVLLRQLLADPSLPGVSAVCLDEVHERQTDTDLVLGMAAEIACLRDDLMVAAMSATVDAQRFADLLAADIIEQPAPTHPLKIIHQPGPVRLGRFGVEQSFLEHMARTTARAAAQTTGSVLVFVPGRREVDTVARHLRTLADTPVFPLHGGLDAAAQDKALDPRSGKKIVVATTIAESSLTVAGVDTVVDSGLARVPKRDAKRGFSGLVTESAAKSSMDQRAGRAGRERPGTVIRCFTPAEYSGAKDFPTPEMFSTDLTQAALQLACWGTPRGQGLKLIDQPPDKAMDDAMDTLLSIGAVTQDGKATKTGKILSTIPADPRLARALVDGTAACGRKAAEVVAVLSDNPAGDIATDIASRNNTRRSRFHREVDRLAAAADTALAALPDHTGNTTAVTTGAIAASRWCGYVTGLAYPGWIAKLMDDGTWLLACGTRAAADGSIRRSHTGWMAVAAIGRTQKKGDGHTGAIIRAAADIDEDTALRLIGTTTTTTVTVTAGGITARQVVRAGAIELSSTPVKPDPADAVAALAEEIKTHGLGMFTFDAKATALRQRLAWAHTHIGAPWPDVSDTALAHTAEMWLAGELEEIARGTPPKQIRLSEPLRRLLPWPAAADFADLVPETLAVPSGRNPAIDYSGEVPVVKVKLQECFGMTASPTVTGVAVRFHLLSPAGRPLAVTDDLDSFFAGPYQEVRKQMRGRYPKHPWPEDPFTARATHRTKKRM